MLENLIENTRKKIGKIEFLHFFLSDVLRSDRVYDFLVDFFYFKIYSKKTINSYPGKLPDFLIVGAPKCGTTYLWNMLKGHPSVEMSPNFLGIKKDKILGKKEVEFFIAYPEKGIKWYKSLFNNNEKLQGEATPDYLFAKNCHKRIHTTLPNAKLIAVLRNPVQRAFSSYNFMKIVKYQSNDYFDPKKSFEENIQIEKNHKYKNGALIARGMYIDQIEHLLKFYKKDQLLILITEEMEKNPELAYKKVCLFLGIKPIFVSDNLKEKINAKPYAEVMNENTKNELEAFFLPYNKKLYKFLGKELPW